MPTELPAQGNDTTDPDHPGPLRARLRAARWRPAALGVLVLVAGLAYATAIGSYKWHLHAKAERLRVEGVPVLADVTDRRNTVGRGGGTDTIRVGYDYQGVRYSRRILCGSAGGCFREPPETMTVRVDPAHPDQFVAENGNTDDSVFVLNAWGGIPFGLVVAAIGGLTIFISTLPAGAPRRPLPRRGPGRDRVRRTGSARQRRRRARR
ncbi:DUF3592 domain-containing protein [Micromonospora sp. GCM10011542]|uniref:DUF3592 domain-containing protein n=1 Tax=Micromonospora sp. GCM10011542 TaxID=3317337 RepID=UPI003618EF27